MHQIETENYGWLEGGLLVEVRDNGKAATARCYNTHYNIDGQYVHQEKLGCTSAINRANQEERHFAHTCQESKAMENWEKSNVYGNSRSYKDK